MTAAEPLTDAINISGWTKKAEGRERNRKLTISCACPVECPLLADGLCIHRAWLGAFLSPRSCAFGRHHWTTGLTARSKGAYDENQKHREQIAALRDGQGPAGEFDPRSMIIIGGWIMLPYYYMTQVPGVPWLEAGAVLRDGKCWIKLEDFTPAVVVALSAGRPQALMGGTITDYRAKSVPRFLYDLKHWLPEVYAAACELAPALGPMTAGPEFFESELIPVTALNSPDKIDQIGNAKISGMVYARHNGWELATDHAGIVFWNGRDESRPTSVVYPLLDTARVHPADAATRLTAYEQGAYCHTLPYKAL